MTKKGDDAQFRLDLGAGPAAKTARADPAVIVPFVDAATLNARREAIQRVASSGIFALPSNLRPR